MKVKYTGATDEQVRWGGNNNPRGVLTEGECYEVEYVDVHSIYTKYYLKEFPGMKFNSVCFKEVNEVISIDEIKEKMINYVIDRKCVKEFLNLKMSCCDSDSDCKKCWNKVLGEKDEYKVVPLVWEKCTITKIGDKE